jgi:shikimate kinase
MMTQEKILDIQKRLKRPIALIGMMGVGKTRLARSLSDALNIDLVDSDDEIERAANMKVKEIFERFGEEYFRDGERRVIQRLVDGQLKVISTGGGAVMTQETADLVFSKTLSIWVRADIDVMVKRTSGSDKRPLLNQGDHREILLELMDKRYPVYEKADIVIESDSSSVKAQLDKMIDKIDHYLLGQG